MRSNVTDTRAANHLFRGGGHTHTHSMSALTRIVSPLLFTTPTFFGTVTHLRYVLGDPMDAATTMGCIAQPNNVTFLQKQVDEAVEKGARVLVGGGATADAAGKGRFFQPTLVADCDHSMSLMMDESFGPVLGVQKVRRENRERRGEEARWKPSPFPSIPPECGIVSRT